MENIPMQLVSDIASHIDLKIINFLENQRLNNSYRDDYNDDDYNINNIICDVFSDALSSKKQSDLSPLARAFKDYNRNRKDIKTRWNTSTKTKCKKLDLTDKNHPFYVEISNYLNSTFENKKLLYGDYTIEEYILQLMNKTDDWSKCKDSFLIEYPGILSLSKTKISSAIKSDIFVNSYMYLRDKYNGNIDGFLRIIPDTMLDFPIFGEKKQKLNVVEENNVLVDTLQLPENRIFRNIINPSIPETYCKTRYSYDNIDMQMFYIMFSHIKNDFYNSRTIMIPLLSFAKVLSQKPNNKCFKRAAERLFSYTNISYELYDSYTNLVLSSYTILDRIDIINPDNFISTDEEPYSRDAYVRVYSSNTLYEDIVNVQITSITKNDYDKLQSPLSQVLCPLLQKERTQLSFNLNCSDCNDEQMTKIYTYSFFASHIRTLPLKANTNNMSKLVEALSEFASQKIYIKSFSISKNSFKIVFIPLSDDEKSDVDFHHNYYIGVTNL